MATAANDSASLQRTTRAGWRQEVVARARMLEVRANIADKRRSDTDVVEAAQVQAVRDLLGDARAATKRRWWFQAPKAWWTGSAIDSAWELVHRAEVALIDVSSKAELYGSVTPLLRWLQQVLPEREAAAWTAELLRRRDAGEVDRAVLRQAHGAAVAANRDWHASLRAFRNLIVAVAAGLALLLLAVDVWHLANTSILPLCHPADGTTTCFGGSSPGKSLIEVELMGMLGGLLSSAFLLSKVRKPPSRYSVLLPQLVLKAIAGAAAALVGVLFVQSGLVLTSTASDRSTLVLLAYAVTFGFSQQLLTQIVDRQSRALLAPPSAAADVRRP